MLSSEGPRRPPPLGKLASRLEALKSPWRRFSGPPGPGEPALELSHNEAARLATDALLEAGEPGYRRVLAEERELSFLSPREIRYIGRHKALGPDPHQEPGETPPERDFGEFGEFGDVQDQDAVSELTSGTYFPMMSDEEPPLLELGWPQAPARFGPSETQIYFQRDRSHNVKDIIRSLISKAKKIKGD
ncbi:unnamed protein product [Menidia menidia]|uniref:(Atlantic silverside) hypothetical protein n=1 Tax=Menidia menidia TaxID=238744 RepID=A0A8S4BN18_9TELE|nr:unnamed protein product [Menidia menidia]